MSAKSPIVLILGAGPRVGQAVARKFGSQGYKVALASRSLKETDSTADQLNITSDFSKPEEVVSAFDKVKRTFGIPSVVVYNASAITWTPPDDPFSIPLADFTHNTNVNIHSAFIAAQEAVRGFAQLPASASRTFIYTGNALNTLILPKFIVNGIGKSAAAHMMWAAADAYKEKGYKFYYADERKADGGPGYAIDAEAHGELYYELANDQAQRPWLQTFVKGVGYDTFENLYAPPQ